MVAAALVRDGASLTPSEALRTRRGNDASKNFQRRLVRYAARMGRLGPVLMRGLGGAGRGAAPAPPPTKGCCLVAKLACGLVRPAARAIFLM